MKNHTNKELEAVVYTDGSCLGNPGPGGWAAVIKKEGEYKEIWGGEKKTTNNRMELTAIIEALNSLDHPYRVTLFTDSKYIYDAVNKKWLDNWISNGWKTGSKSPVKNRDLWEKIVELFKIHKVKVEWIPSHKGNVYNERCDRLAKKAAQGFKS